MPCRAGRAGQRLLATLSACLLLSACGGTLNGPIDLFHGLEGGEIAANRPPPPGAGEPYPRLGTVPARPVVAGVAYRTALQAQLVAERDRTERVAADTPIEAVPHAPQAAPPPSAVAAPAAANAMLDTAEAPARPVTPPSPAASSPPASSPPASSPAASSPAAPGPSDPPLTIVGVPGGTAGLPDMPASPPPPAILDGVVAEPASDQGAAPVRLPRPALGTPVFFPVASAVLPPSQTQGLKDFLVHRAGRGVEVLGLGDAASDTPYGQATAIALGLARAHAVAQALQALHVPQASLRLGADAFGRGAVLRLLP